MPVVRLPDEELQAFPGKPLETFYSTTPVDLDGLMSEVGLFECTVKKIVDYTVKESEKQIDLIVEQQKENYEAITVGCIITFYADSHLLFEPEFRKEYVVIEAVQGGYKIREIPTILEIPEATDVTEALRELFPWRHEGQT